MLKFTYLHLYTKNTLIYMNTLGLMRKLFAKMT